MGQNRKSAICIGVASAPRLAYLAGAVNGARAFHAWASSFNYEASLVTDESEPVTIERLRKELVALLKPEAGSIHRLLVYFAGHGLIRELEEGLWLLSDWDSERRAVAVEPLRRRLYMWDIQQIAIFADACRKLPQDVDAADLTPDAVLGKGPVKRATTPDLDKFIAAQDGEEAFMVPGANPDEDRCIFSGVLLQGLWGTQKSAFSQAWKTKITSQSLGAYLKSEAPQIASRYKLKLDPTWSSTFPEGDNIYFGDGAAPEPPQFPQWPPPEALAAKSAGPGAGAMLKHFAFKLSESLDTLVSSTGDLIGLPTLTVPGPDGAAAPSFIDRLRNQPRPQALPTRCGFAVQGAPVRTVWAATPISVLPEADRTWWSIGGGPSAPPHEPTPVLIEFADGLMAATVALPEFITTMLRDETGVSALVYRPTGAPDAVTAGAEEALAELERGALRADAASDFAAKLREFKHVDPVLGVVSAYLYDSIGDTDSIRRLAYYYVMNAQPIPYDIALLAQIDAETRDGLLWARVPSVASRAPRTEDERSRCWTHSATEAVEGAVGGLWPWMRQGWTFLDDPLDSESKLIAAGLPALSKHLKPARFATLDAEGGRKLANLFGLSPKA